MIVSNADRPWKTTTIQMCEYAYKNNLFSLDDEDMIEDTPWKLRA